MSKKEGVKEIAINSSDVVEDNFDLSKLALAIDDVGEADEEILYEEIFDVSDDEDDLEKDIEEEALAKEKETGSKKEAQVLKEKHIPKIRKWLKTTPSESVNDYLDGKGESPEDLVKKARGSVSRFTAHIPTYVYMLVPDKKFANAREFFQFAFYIGMGSVLRPNDHLIVSSMLAGVPENVVAELGDVDKEMQILAYLADTNIKIIQIRLPSRNCALFVERCMIAACGTQDFHNKQLGNLTPDDPVIAFQKLAEIGTGFLHIFYQIFASEGKLYTDLFGPKTTICRAINWDDFDEESLPTYLPNWGKRLVKGIISGKYVGVDNEIFMQFLAAYKGPALRLLQHQEGFSKEQYDEFLADLMEKYGNARTCHEENCENLCRLDFCWLHKPLNTCKLCEKKCRVLYRGCCYSCRPVTECNTEDCRQPKFKNMQYCRFCYTLLGCTLCKKPRFSTTQYCKECFQHLGCSKCEKPRWRDFQYCRDCFKSLGCTKCKAERFGSSQFCSKCLNDFGCKTCGEPRLNNMQYCSKCFSLKGCTNCGKPRWKSMQFCQDCFKSLGCTKCGKPRANKLQHCKDCFKKLGCEKIIGGKRCGADRWETRQFCKPCASVGLKKTCNEPNCNKPRFESFARCEDHVPWNDCLYCGERTKRRGRNFCNPTCKADYNSLPSKADYDALHPK